MANKQRGEMKLKLGNEEFILKPSFENLANIEDAVGYSLVNLMRRIVTQELLMRDMAKVVKAVSQTDKSEGDVGKLMFEEGLVEVRAILGEFLADAISGGQKQGKKQAAKE